MKRMFVIVLLLLGCANAHATAFKSTNWDVILGFRTTIGGYGMQLASLPWAIDGASGEGFGGLDLNIWSSAVFCLQYRENGQLGWLGQTGFYDSDGRAPYFPGESKSYDNIYLWVKNATLSTPYRIQFVTGSDDYDRVPYGYIGHLVLDHVPTECNWDGPTDFWLDLGKSNSFVLPLIVTANPLESTRMHMTIYAPVPEPASLAALATGLLGVGGFAIRRIR